MTREPGRRRSKAVNLALVGITGTAALAGGCSNAGYQRNVYRSHDDCVADYRASVCLVSNRQADGTFLGPVYRIVRGRPSACRSGDPGGGSRGSLRIGTRIERNGFGVACSSRSTSYRSWGG